LVGKPTKMIGTVMIAAGVFIIAIGFGVMLSNRFGPKPVKSSSNTQDLQALGIDQLELDSTDTPEPQSDEEELVVEETTTTTDPADAESTAASTTAGKDDDSPAKNEAGPAGKPVQNEALGLSAEIPTDFYIQNPGNYGEASLQITSYDPAVAAAGEVGGDAIKIEIYAATKAADTGLNRWLQNQPVSEIEDLIREARQLADHPAVFESGYGVGYYLAYYVDRGDNVLIAFAYAERQKLEVAKEVLDRIMETLAFSEV